MRVSQSSRCPPARLAPSRQHSHLVASPHQPRRAVRGATRDCPQRLTCCSSSDGGDTSDSVAAQSGARQRARAWPEKKAELLLMRSDGYTCSREVVDACGTLLTWRQTSTSQELLQWKAPPRWVLALKKLDAALNAEFDEAVRFLGEEKGMVVVVEPHEYERMAAQYGWPFLETYNAEERRSLHKVVDFLVCLGGDGVILHACTLFDAHVPPIVSFNMGSMGFLTKFSIAEHREALSAVIHGNAVLEACGGDINDPSQRGVLVTMRMRLRCEVVRRGEEAPESTIEVLNEVVVDRGSSPFLSNIECWEKGQLITRVQADGVMLATPTGSTAYSVAAGGSLVHPTLPAILFTPICPHSLSFRPVILPDYAELELRVPDDARSTAWVCFDGKRRQELRHGDRVRVRMSPCPVPTINRQETTGDWFSSLSRCFNWSDRIEQKAFGSAGGPATPGSASQPALDAPAASANAALGPSAAAAAATTSSTAANPAPGPSTNALVPGVHGPSTISSDGVTTVITGGA